jgi:hypothetical protein
MGGCLHTDGVVTSGVVVGGILLAGDELLRVVQVSVCASADLINASWLQIDHQASRNELASTSLGEEGLEGVILDGSALWLLTVRLDTVLQAEKLQRTRQGEPTCCGTTCDALYDNLHTSQQAFPTCKSCVG